MATLRKANAYRRIKRAYTRKSKFKKQSFIATILPHKVVRFDMGDAGKKYKYKVKLINLEDIQIRHNALESVRLMVNRKLQNKLGSNYHFKINKYPHHVLRENKMLSGAGADRMQTGMSKSFGKAVGSAVQAKKRSVIFTASVNDDGLEVAKESLKGAFVKMPCRCSVEVEKSLLEKGSRKEEKV